MPDEMKNGDRVEVVNADGDHCFFGTYAGTTFYGTESHGRTLILVAHDQEGMDNPVPIAESCVRKIDKTGYQAVEFISPEMACAILSGCGVRVRTTDGIEATGILVHHIPPDGSTTMIRIHDVITDELILGTDIRNLKEILVP